jgi:hypothetical protein
MYVYVACVPECLIMHGANTKLKCPKCLQICVILYQKPMRQGGNRKEEQMRKKMKERYNYLHNL